jgi:hypothetical protein
MYVLQGTSFNRAKMYVCCVMLIYGRKIIVRCVGMCICCSVDCSELSIYPRIKAGFMKQKHYCYIKKI